LATQGSGKEKTKQWHSSYKRRCGMATRGHARQGQGAALR
jgi:hypothetical protein